MKPFNELMLEALSQVEIDKHMAKNTAIQFSKKDKHGNPKFKLRGNITFQGLKIAIENAKGDTRAGIDPDGYPWVSKMYMAYGYIKKTIGADDEEIDVYIMDNEKSDKVFVVKQHAIEKVKKWPTDNCPKCKQHARDCSCPEFYDEDKLFLGADSKEEVVKAYNKQYNNNRFLGPIVELTIDELKKLIGSGNKVEIPFDKE